MKFKIRIKAPVLTAVKVTNELEVITAAAEHLARRIVERTWAGEGAEGPLARPKSGDHQPLQASGSMIGSIAAEVREKASSKGWDKDFIATIFPRGPRPPEEQAGIKAKKKAAAKKSHRLRAAIAIGSALQALAGRVAPEDQKPLRLSRIRLRTADTNAALAGILSVPPKDLRARNGGRAMYRVFEVRDAEAEELAAIVEAKMKVELVQTGETTLESK